MVDHLKLGQMPFKVQKFTTNQEDWVRESCAAFNLQSPDVEGLFAEIALGGSAMNWLAQQCGKAPDQCAIGQTIWKLERGKHTMHFFHAMV